MTNETNLPSSDGLAQLSQLAADLYLAETFAVEAMAIAKLRQQEADHIANVLIPELMEELGMEEFKTTSGIKLGIRDVYRASIPAARREEAYAWLDSQNEGSMIKHSVVTGFPRDRAEAAETLRAKLEAEGYTVKSAQKIEPATLKKWVKDRLEAGEVVPMDLFGAARFKQAKITARPESPFGE
tara:strand:+ start:39710 stop:40261 length:552 start_codon:yes stop_codon:yes gene_type:complete